MTDPKRPDRFILTIPKPLRKRLQDYAAESGLTEAEIVRRLIDAHLPKTPTGRPQRPQPTKEIEG